MTHTTGERTIKYLNWDVDDASITRRIKAPDKVEPQELVQLISPRAGRCLEESTPSPKRSKSACYAG